MSSDIQSDSEISHLSMTGINHDAVEGNTLLSEAECKLKVFGVGGMIEVDGYGNRCVVCAMSK